MKLRPGKDETEQQFLDRLDGVLKNSLPTEQQEGAALITRPVGQVVWNHREKIWNAPEEFPKMVRIWHLEPGLVHYEYLNDGRGLTILVNRAFMDRMRPTLPGKPIINERHKDLSPEQIRAIFKQGQADGVIFSAGNDPMDGWDYADVIVWDEATVENIRAGFSASCQYEVTEWLPGGTYHNIPYEREAVAGAYEHIAIVRKGRYEGVRILLMNSKEGGSTMKLAFWRKDKEKGTEVKNSVDLDTDKATIEVDGKEVPVSAAIAAFTAQQEAEALANAAPAKLADDQMVEINGKKVSGADLKAAFAAQQKVKAKNESDAAMKKAHEDGDHKDKDIDNCPMCNKAKNDAEEERKAKEKAEADEKAKNEAAALDEKARNAGQLPEIKLPLTVQERAEKGREQYGSAKVAA